MPDRLCSGGRTLLVLCACVLLLLLSSSLIVSQLSAQQLTGAMSGTVRDSSGGVVGGATVAVVNTETNLRITAETTRNGSFQLADLPAGTYTVTFSLAGFKSELHSLI